MTTTKRNAIGRLGKLFVSFILTALGLPLSRAYKKPSEPKAVSIKFTRSFCYVGTVGTEGRLHH